MRRITIDKIILDPGDMLYRYDICDNLPTSWDIKYHNIEYAGSEFGDKNCIGAIFLYDNSFATKQVLAAAINNQREKGTSIKNITITSATVDKDLILLDLAQRVDRCCNIISVLHELDIDVTTRNFINYSPKKSFDLIHSDLENLYSKDMSIRILAAKKIDEFFYNKPSYLGQLLTDFKNGEIFKQQLEEKGFEGYVFKEFDSSNTYCIFSPDKLSRPSHESVDIENNEEIQELIAMNWEERVGLR